MSNLYIEPDLLKQLTSTDISNFKKWARTGLEVKHNVVRGCPIEWVEKPFLHGIKDLDNPLWWDYD